MTERLQPGPLRNIEIARCYKGGSRCFLRFGEVQIPDEAYRSAQMRPSTPHSLTSLPPGRPRSPIRMSLTTDSRAPILCLEAKNVDEVPYPL